MLKNLLLLSLVGALVADPSTSSYPFFRAESKEDIDEYKDYLKKTQEERVMTLEEAMALNPDSSPWENSGKYQGDILLHDEEIDDMLEEYAGNSTISERNGLVATRNRWPGGIIIYEIAPNYFNQAQLDMIYWAMDVFSRRSCTRWRRRTNERDFVRITGRQTGCYAHVGYWAGFGAHTLNLARGCFVHMIVVHEMLHSAGFNHMHQTFVRDNYVRINWNNMAQSNRFAFEIQSSQLVSMLGLPYEYASNQHYGATAFSINGRPTIEPRFNTNGQMGQLTHLTGWDIWRLQRLYNCPGAWSVEVDPNDANKPYSEEFATKMNSCR